MGGRMKISLIIFIVSIIIGTLAEAQGLSPHGLSVEKYYKLFKIQKAWSNPSPFQQKEMRLMEIA